MTHLKLDEGKLTPTPSQHGDIWHTTATAPDGRTIFVIVGPGNDTTDLHLTRKQVHDHIEALIDLVKATPSTHHDIKDYLQ